MTLADFMKENRLTDADFAAKIAVDRSTVSRLRRTNQCPSRATMQAIAEATGGAVTADDFWLSAAA